MDVDCILRALIQSSQSAEDGSDPPILLFGPETEGVDDDYQNLYKSPSNFPRDTLSVTQLRGFLTFATRTDSIEKWISYVELRHSRQKSKSSSPWNSQFGFAAAMIGWLKAWQNHDPRTPIYEKLLGLRPDYVPAGEWRSRLDSLLDPTDLIRLQLLRGALNEILRNAALATKGGG